jgi:FSR family fosmidomycin resistance protein-like MFS transporter
LLPPLVVGLLVSGPALGVVFAALAGAATIATFAVTIVMGQEYLPGRLGVSAGVTIGLSIGLGGVGAPLLGLLADANGYRSVFVAVACLPVLALLLSLTLPSRGPHPAAAVPGARVVAPREPA